MEEKIAIAARVGNFVSTILLGNTKEMMVRVDEKMKHMGMAIMEIKSDIKDMGRSLTAHGLDIAGLKAHTRYGVAESPTAPNEMGKELLKLSGFEKAYPSLRPKIFALLDAKKLRTLYDYEKGAGIALKELQDDPLMDSLKEYAVSHPDEPLDLIFQVASWVVRDDYAREHPTRSSKG
jgi:hypothetical protein